MPIPVPAAVPYILHRLCGRVVGQRAAPAVNAGPEQRPRGVPGPGQESRKQREVAAVIQQHGADGAALAVEAGVLVLSRRRSGPSTYMPQISEVRAPQT